MESFFFFVPYECKEQSERALLLWKEKFLYVRFDLKDVEERHGMSYFPLS